VGDYILVNKDTYDLRVPILNNTFVELNHPQRGEVMVFHYPKDPSLDYIKRVVGVPGDRIEYREKQLYINGRKLDVTLDGGYSYTAPGLHQVEAERYQETLGEHKHSILIVPETATLDGQVVVPEGQYFMMGDNRDNSNDSRFWGFVPEHNIVGRAFMIWWNFDHFDRIGNIIQ
jgi:signal peptidase I